MLAIFLLYETNLIRHYVDCFSNTHGCHNCMNEVTVVSKPDDEFSWDDKNYITCVVRHTLIKYLLWNCIGRFEGFLNIWENMGEPERTN